MVTPREGNCPAIRVDFLKCPGVGKSTLIRATLGLLRGLPRTCARLPWVSIDQVGRIADENAWLAHFGRVPLLGRAKLFLRLVSEGFRRCLLGGAPVRLPVRELDLFEEAGCAGFLEAYGDVIFVLVRECLDPELVPGKVAVRYYRFVNWLSRWMFATAFGGNIGILADNSRFTRAMAALIVRDHLVEAAGGLGHVEECFRPPAGPHAVVHVVCDLEETLRRVDSRRAAGFIHPAHQGRSQDEIRAYTRLWEGVNRHAVGIFRGWGIPVLTIDSAQPLEGNANRICEFLAALEGARSQGLDGRHKCGAGWYPSCAK